MCPTPDILELVNNNISVPSHTNSRLIIEYGLSTPKLPLLIQGSVLANFKANIQDKCEKLQFSFMHYFKETPTETLSRIYLY